MALQLQRYGITRVRPLEGGLRQWREREYPTERLDTVVCAVDVESRGVDSSLSRLPSDRIGGRDR